MCIRRWKTLSIFDRSEIGLKFSTIRGDPLFLKIGITLASLSLSGKIPVEKDRFMMFERIFERWYSTIEIIASGRLWGPEALRLFKEQRMSETSSGEVGEVKKEFRLLFLSQSEKWCRVKGIFERTLSAIVEKKSLRTSETVEDSDVIELF